MKRRSSKNLRISLRREEKRRNEKRRTKKRKEEKRTEEISYSFSENRLND